MFFLCFSLRVTACPQSFKSYVIVKLSTVIISIFVFSCFCLPSVCHLFLSSVPTTLINRLIWRAMFSRLVLVLVASILTLGVISCDRFFGIVFAMKALVTTRRPSLLMAAVWLAAVAVSVPMLIYRRQMTRQWLNHTEIWCADDWPAVSPSLKFF